MKNHKQLIGIFRVTIYLILAFFFAKEMDAINVEYFVSDIIHGSHTAEFRESTSVKLIMLPILFIFGFYIIQTILYIFIGNALNGKSTGPLRFLGYLITGIQECANDPNFWSSSSNSSDLGNIEKVLSYRDNKMALMSNKEAAEYMKGTGHVDMMISRPDLKQSRKTLSYLNNKVALMDNETALNFLKGNK